jgi:Type II secretion system protein C
MARAVRGGSARPLLLTLLLAGVAVLSLTNWHLYTTPIDISPLAPPARSPAGKDAKDLDLSTPLDNKPLIVFEQMVQRPLFNADRKPIERSKEANEAPAAPALNTGMQLVGIVKSAGTPGRALIRFAGEPMGKWVPEGETVNGWRLTAVKTVSVVLEGNGQTQELQFKAAARQATGEATEPGPQPPKRKTR